MVKKDPGLRRDISTPQHYPMECVRVSDFMRLERMVPRSQLRDLAVVSPPDNAVVHFISHQWLGDSHPDPEGVQLCWMKAIFREALEGRAQRLFSPKDWEAFSNSWSKGSHPAALKVAEARGLGKGGDVMLTSEQVQKDVAEGYVWLDFLSVPQLTDRLEAFKKASDALAVQLQDNLAAVNSIPHYVERSDYFWILAPKANHTSSGAQSDLSTCRNRGWCRLEEWANFLCMRQKMPLIIAGGDDNGGPWVQTIGPIDYITSHLGRPKKAPCNGSFTCCRIGHKVRLDDGTMADIPCDKNRILPVIQKLLQAKLDFYAKGNQRLMHAFILGISLVVYAGSSAEFEESSIDPDESLESFLKRIRYTSIDERDEGGSTCMHWAMLIGHPNVVTKVATMRPGLISEGATSGFTPLMAGVYRPDGRLEEIIEKHPRFADPAEINAATSNGTTALDHAAKGGFHVMVALLLRCRADPETRRKDNGFTPLLSAAEAGYGLCVKELLEHRADPNAQGAAGETGLELAANPITLIGNSASGGKSAVTRLLRAHPAEAALRRIKMSL